jgi:RNA polymerase sigma factor (sigma-70 family)
MTCDFDRTTVCERFKPLVRRTISSLMVTRNMREDAEQQGMIGLLNAYDRYDATLSVNFSVFARPYVKGAILRGIYAKDKEITFESRGTSSEVEQFCLRPSTDISGKVLELTPDMNEVFRLRCPTPQPVEAGADASEVATVHRWLDSLAPKDAWLIWRRFWQGGSSAEIATELSHSVHWVNERQRILLTRAADFIGAH